jgi:hypothetical protein
MRVRAGPWPQAVGGAAEQGLGKGYRLLLLLCAQFQPGCH